MDNQLAKEVVLKYPDKVLEPFDGLFEAMGYEAVCTLCDLFGGSTLYIPTKRRVFSKCFSEEIKREFNGANVRELSKKYGFCDRSIRYILSEYSRKR